MRKLTLLLALMFPVAVLAFPFDVEKTLNGAQIAVDTLALSDNLASASLSNYGQRDAVCKVRFRNGPEAPRTRKTRVRAGETAHVTARFNSTVIRMRVNVECKQD
ncbi:3-phosphoglycerate kinase [Pseudomonas sp. C27(2019)]|uniref:3-phosphoglycerate kinase n=1 Tax=Pseudomonas sp. C27(2019) TaxID=2604941 RepID=UPI00124942EF|nr:3-phosphoglycerate kinase [Pseudomonas sp. C27(2019)]QEY58634.1 3-phosphoglycerate kinase [Pseudomonas sp. C27(2019)]